jgi:SAM-dependent methyltransferase
MTAEVSVRVVDRIIQVLDHLGVQRAHIAGAMPGDWQALGTAFTDRVASLSLVCPTALAAGAVRSMAARLLLVHGDHGPIVDRVRAAAVQIPEATVVTLPGYAGLPFSDVAAERRDQVGVALVDFLRRMEAVASSALTLTHEYGELAGISYRIQGSGPPLVLLPLALAPSQWEPLLPQLSQHFTTITLGGPHLGYMPVLEGRGQASGYVRIVRNLIDEVALQPGEAILDAGCGSGVLDRWLAGHTNRAHTITALDINRYLLREAEMLVHKIGLEHVITFEEGSAEALPFHDNRFDVSLSLTVMEEGDADQMLAELVRVTKPGGRIAAIVRGDDCPALLTPRVRPEIEAKAARAVGAGVVERGCADASLYRRFHAAGLVGVRKFPQLAVYDESDLMAEFYQNRIMSVLSPGEVEEWEAATTKAKDEQGFVIAVTHHCAVGIKPETDLGPLIPLSKVRPSSLDNHGQVE